MHNCSGQQAIVNIAGRCIRRAIARLERTEKQGAKTGADASRTKVGPIGR
ncbi:MAG: hypothetical protein AB4352_26040 [Hormoscilla sp.]